MTYSHANCTWQNCSASLGAKGRSGCGVDLSCAVSVGPATAKYLPVVSVSMQDYRENPICKLYGDATTTIRACCKKCPLGRTFNYEARLLLWNEGNGTALEQQDALPCSDTLLIIQRKLVHKRVSLSLRHNYKSPFILLHCRCTTSTWRGGTCVRGATASSRTCTGS